MMQLYTKRDNVQPANSFWQPAPGKPIYFIGAEVCSSHLLIVLLGWSIVIYIAPVWCWGVTCIACGGRNHTWQSFIQLNSKWKLGAQPYILLYLLPYVSPESSQGLREGKKYENSNDWGKDGMLNLMTVLVKVLQYMYIFPHNKIIWIG